MKLGMNLTLAMLCTHCDEPLGEEHDESPCPKAQIKKLSVSNRTYSCPKCDERKVELNTDDFLECRACKTRFSRGLVAGGENPDTLERVHILDQDYENAAIPVLVLKVPGQGEFRIDKLIAQVKEAHGLVDA